MFPRTLLLLIAVLALGAVACETDAPPKPLVERATPDALGEAPGVTDHTPLPDVAPVSTAPAPLPPPAVQPPPAVRHPSPAPPALQPATAPRIATPPVPSSQDPAGAPAHAHEGHSHHGGGIGGVVERVAPLP